MYTFLRRDRYDNGEFHMSDTYTDRVVIKRRISRDTAPGIHFTIFLDGESHSTMTHATKPENAVLVTRGLRGMCDGFVAVLLPGYLLALGFGQLAVGLISTTTLFGSALAIAL